MTTNHPARDSQHGKGLPVDDWKKGLKLDNGDDWPKKDIADMEVHSEITRDELITVTEAIAYLRLVESLLRSQLAELNTKKLQSLVSFQEAVAQINSDIMAAKLAAQLGLAGGNTVILQKLGELNKLCVEFKDDKTAESHRISQLD